MRSAEVTVSTSKLTGKVVYGKLLSDCYSHSTEACSFHQFAQESSEGETYVVAIIETDSGSLHTVGINALRFTD